MLELNKIYNYNCLDGLKQLDNDSVDLTVTSPPYDSLRTYADKNTGDECEWNFEIFKPIAQELYRVTKKGGVVVWVVGDACINNGETGSSFRQALYFQELGFKLHDTMIYEKNSSSFPAKLTSKRYSQIFEYMFVFSKGKIRGDIKLIADKRNKWAGWTNWGEHSQYDADGNLIKTQNIKPIAEFSLRTNIWRYPVSFNDKTGHPAVFPEKLAEDHILSWSNEGETVLDPFMGSGTTAKMAMMNHRNYIGFEINSGYFEESLKRVAKYEGKYNDKVFSVATDELTNVEDADTEEIQANPVDDKDFEKKAELWKELTAELEDYFNTQSLGILKNLKVNLTFTSKANDKRVEKVLQERGGVTITAEVLKAETPDRNGRVYTEDCLKNAAANFHNSVFDENNGRVLGEISHTEKPIYTAHEIKLPENPKIDFSEAIVQKIEEVSKKAAERAAQQYLDNFFGKGISLEESFPYLNDYQADSEPIQMPVVEDVLSEENTISSQEGETEAVLAVEPPKRKRGRPKGSKNKPVIQQEPVIASEPENEEEKTEEKMVNKSIEKTSNEEGKYAEYIVEYLSRETGTKYEDVSNNPEYQKLDIDALINGAKIEIKNDTIIHSSKNAVYEKNTHVHYEDKLKVDAVIKSKDFISFDELPAEFGSPGCNEKCVADKIFYISSIEDEKNPKHYHINWERPAFLIDNKKFKQYVRSISIPTSRIRTVYHPEDKVYNVIILFNINELIEHGVARGVNGYTLEVLKKKASALTESHTSSEIKQLLLENNQ